MLGMRIHCRPAVRIYGFHPGDPGLIPGNETFCILFSLVLLLFYTQPLCSQNLPLFSLQCSRVRGYKDILIHSLCGIFSHTPPCLMLSTVIRPMVSENQLPLSIFSFVQMVCENQLTRISTYLPKDSSRLLC